MERETEGRPENLLPPDKLPSLKHEKPPTPDVGPGHPSQRMQSDSELEPGPLARPASQLMAAPVPKDMRPSSVTKMSPTHGVTPSPGSPFFCYAGNLSPILSISPGDPAAHHRPFSPPLLGPGQYANMGRHSAAAESAEGLTSPGFIRGAAASTLAPLQIPSSRAPVHGHPISTAPALANAAGAHPPDSLGHSAELPQLSCALPAEVRHRLPRPLPTSHALPVELPQQSENGKATKLELSSESVLFEMLGQQSQPAGNERSMRSQHSNRAGYPVRMSVVTRNRSPNSYWPATRSANGSQQSSAAPSTSNTESVNTAPADGSKRKQCFCKKSKCLKLYCECFAAGIYCNGCKCACCYNTEEHEAVRKEAVDCILERNPNAFRPKIESNDFKHIKGCHCKKSGCNKKYCECFQAGVPCSEKCKCKQCRNTFGYWHGGDQEDADEEEEEDPRPHKRTKGGFDPPGAGGEDSEDAMAEMKHTVSGGRHAGHHSFQVLPLSAVGHNFAKSDSEYL